MSKSKVTHFEKSLKKLGNVESCTMMVARDSLRPAPWNPPIRTSSRYVFALKESMMVNGFWDYRPILADRNGMIIDGHRRWYVAGQLGISLVPVTVVDEDADRLWAEVNGTAMVLSGAQVLQAVAGGLKSRPAKYKKAIDKLEEVMGMDGIKSLAERGISLDIIKMAQKIGRYCTLTSDLKFLHDCVIWIMKNPNSSSVSNQAMRAGIPPSKLAESIRDGRMIEVHYE